METYFCLAHLALLKEILLKGLALSTMLFPKDDALAHPYHLRDGLNTAEYQDFLLAHLVLFEEVLIKRACHRLAHANNLYFLIMPLTQPRFASPL